MYVSDSIDINFKAKLKSPEISVSEHMRFSTDYDCYLYGVFDGHDGSKAAHFAAERIPAELLLGQLSPDSNDNDVIKTLEQAFQIVEHGFFESIDVELAKKTHLQSQVCF